MDEHEDLKKRLTEGRLSRREFIKLSVIAGLSGSAVMSALAACAPTSAPTGAATVPPTAAPILPTATPAPVPLSVEGNLTMKLRASFIPQANEILRATVEQWGADNNIPVAVDIVSMNDIQTITATAAETGAGPDIIELNQASAHTYAQVLADVSDVAEDLGSRYGGWYNSAIEACKVSNVWRSVPRYYPSHAINYRTDVLEAIGAGVPATWEELYEIGKGLKAAGLPQIGFPLGHAVGDGNDFNYSVLWSYGGSDIASDGATIAIDSAETREALAFMKKLFDETMPPDTLSYDDSSNNRAFNAGAISVTNNAASIYINARNQVIKVQDVNGDERNLSDLMDHFVYPAGPAGAVTYAEFMSQGIMGYSRNVEAAKALITYLNEREPLMLFAMPNYSFAFPALRVYKDDPLMPWNTNPKIAAFKDYAEVSHLPGYPSQNFVGGNDAYVKWVIVDMFASVCGGMATIDQAIATAVPLLEESYS
jgi:multiple sugar transport system substrate-binding protein